MCSASDIGVINCSTWSWILKCLGSYFFGLLVLGILEILVIVPLADWTTNSMHQAKD